MKPRLLITGAAGFIGTNLLERLTKPHLTGASGIKGTSSIQGPSGIQGTKNGRAVHDEGYEILAVDLVPPHVDVQYEIADITTTDWGFLDQFKPEYVIHLAALTNHRLCENLTKARATNVDATQTLFSKLASLGGVRKIIFPSSIVVYADHASIPLQEDTSPLDTHHNNYSLTKGYCEDLCQYFRKPPYNLPILTFRLANIYGPHQEWRPERFPNLIPQIILQSLRDKRIEVWTRTPVRDFVYVSDVVEAFVCGLQSPYLGIINIASGTGTSVGAICEEVSRQTGSPVADLGKPNSGPTHIVCDTSKALLHLNWKSTTSIPEGLSRTISYYQQHIN